MSAGDVRGGMLSANAAHVTIDGGLELGVLVVGVVLV